MVAYTAADLDHTAGNTRTEQEQNDPDARPELSGPVVDMDRYDVVPLGYPIWWGRAPKVFDTFLMRCDFSGKTIVPFCTSGSSGIGSSAANLRALVPSAVWRDGPPFADGAAHAEVTGWIGTLDLDAQREEDAVMPKLAIQAGERSVIVTLEDSESTRTLLARLPLSVTWRR